jgi:D-sedoheptulose 7-phosphate isomerase/D-glycero-D-manno-heptose 1,7-bisphosphate phosphatase
MDERPGGCALPYADVDSRFVVGRPLDEVVAKRPVHAENYEIVEDTHQSLMHSLAQHIRQAHMDEHLISQRKF